MAKFDWYEGTYHGLEPAYVLASLDKRLDLSEVKPSQPKHGYLSGYEFFRGTKKLATIWAGGNPGVHFFTSGDRSPEMVQIYRELGAHNITRADACIDWIEPGLFDELTTYFRHYAEQKKLTIEMMGDWHRGTARTIYIGSRSSTCQLVIYEKGCQLGADPNWVRMEVRVKPKGARREWVSTWTADELFAASAWLTEALHNLGFHTFEARSLGTVYKPSDEARARLYLAKQYGGVITRWADELGWQNMARELFKLIDSVGEQHQLATLQEIDHQEKS